MSKFQMRGASKYLFVGLFLSAWIPLVARAGFSQDLKPTTLADGSTIGVPAYWQVMGQSPGSVDLKGPRGEGVTLGNAFPVYRYNPAPALTSYLPMVAPCCDPVRATEVLVPQIASLQHSVKQPAPELRRIVSSQPAAAFGATQAAYLLMEMDLNGHKLLEYAYVLCSPTGMNEWMYYLSGVAAPEAIFRDELPLMINVWNSWSVNPQVEQERLTHAIEANRESWEIYQSAEQNSQRALRSANCAWDDLVSGQIEIENPQTGEHKKVRNDTAEWWINRGWQYVQASRTSC